MFSMNSHFHIRTSRAVSVDSVKGQRQPANLPTENSRPPIPTRCTIYCAPTCESWRRLISKLAHRPTSQSDLRPHESNLNHFSSSESTSRHCSRDRALRQTYARGMSRHVFRPLDPGGEVRGCSVSCTIAMSDISPLVFIAALRSIGSFQN